ncbi:hypothetical protein FOMPIDRAFT_1025408 [Fomitopsis schrenkii]|uniref:Uncharacterized protein n=1 Tax=Fomitopsis schrenkii TaxID=2126942 RepID=S8F3S2_FOMSC|nr:hypothetical protein FOMPIDRAFT_1025408 [Fomitopsis schrenkii]
MNHPFCLPGPFPSKGKDDFFVVFVGTSLLVFATSRGRSIRSGLMKSTRTRKRARRNAALGNRRVHEEC